MQLQIPNGEGVLACVQDCLEDKDAACSGMKRVQGTMIV